MIQEIAEGESLSSASGSGSKSHSKQSSDGDLEKQELADKIDRHTRAKMNSGYFYFKANTLGHRY